MPLDRQSIERKDFPVGLRGYDPQAVDAHLATVADEIADYKRSARHRSDTLASSASDQVRAIIEAAENSAADLQREAESVAREIRDEANREALATREQAAEQAQEHVAKASEATSSMLQRLDSMENELSALIALLRTGGNRLNADLQLLATNLSEAGDAIGPRARFEPEPEPQSRGEAIAAPSDATVEVEEVVVAHAETSEDAEGARLIALNMALNGTPRDETARYLSENFALSDRERLLDEVYASVEG